MNIVTQIPSGQSRENDASESITISESHHCNDNPSNYSLATRRRDGISLDYDPYNCSRPVSQETPGYNPEAIIDGHYQSVQIDHVEQHQSSAQHMLFSQANASTMPVDILDSEWASFVQGYLHLGMGGWEA